MKFITGRVQRGEVTAKSGRALAWRLEPLIVTMGNQPIERIGPAAIDRWARQIGHLSPATRHAYLITTRMFCAWLVKENVIRRNPLVDMPNIRQPRTVPRALSVDDIAKVLSAAPDERALAILWLMVGMGLRCAEVAGLEVGNYDRVARTMLIVGKGGHERVLPVPDEVAAAVNLYTTSTGIQAGPLIRSKSSSAGLQPHTVSSMVAGWMKDAGIKQRAFDGVSAHACRHTAASDVLDRNPDLRIVQAMLGHANLSSTAIYLRRAQLGPMREAMSGRHYCSGRP